MGASIVPRNLFLAAARATQDTAMCWPHVAGAKLARSATMGNGCSCFAKDPIGGARASPLPSGPAFFVCEPNVALGPAGEQ